MFIATSLIWEIREEFILVTCQATTRAETI